MNVPERPRRAPGESDLPSWSQLRQQAQLAANVGDAMHAAYDRAVRASRLCGRTWSEIGSGVGITRQAARKRWHWVDDVPVAISTDPLTGRGMFTCPRTGLVWRTGRDLESVAVPALE